MDMHQTLLMLAAVAASLGAALTYPTGGAVLAGLEEGHGLNLAASVNLLDSSVGQESSSSGTAEGHEHIILAHPKYVYRYGVEDPHTGDYKDAKEERDGDVVRGEYSLLQPDGRKRTVHYTSDKHGGFNAIVSYSGHAIHPEEHYGHGQLEGQPGSQLEHQY